MVFSTVILYPFLTTAVFNSIAFRSVEGGCTQRVCGTSQGGSIVRIPWSDGVGKICSDEGIRSPNGACRNRCVPIRGSLALCEVRTCQFSPTTAETCTLTSHNERVGFNPSSHSCLFSISDLHRCRDQLTSLARSSVQHTRWNRRDSVPWSGSAFTAGTCISA